MFVLQESSIDPATLKASHGNPASGAFVSFEGIVRPDQHKEGQVNALLYIADSAACISEGEKILKEALSKFSINEAVCVQRTGKLNAGEIAIWIGVWAGHRDEAFKACRYVIEEVKKRLVIWKKEFFSNGQSKWEYGPHLRLDAGPVIS